MRHTFNTAIEFDAFLQTRKLSHMRGGNKRERQKWRRGELPEQKAIACDHDDGKSLKDWDCGCSWGCDACHINVVCSDCNFAFVDRVTAEKMVSSWLVESRTG